MEQKKPTILVADDEPGVRKVVSRMLETAGYRVVEAQDGGETLDHIRRGGIDLVILDIWMPDKTGLEVIDELHGLAHPPRVIILTSDTTSETVIQAIRENAYIYLAKPIDTEALMAAIGSALSAGTDDALIEVLSATPEWIELLVPCDLSTVARIRSFLSRLDTDLTLDIREAVGIAFDELLLNAIEWGGQLDPERKVRIAYLRTKHFVLYRISDPGKGFDPARITIVSDLDEFSTPDHPRRLRLARPSSGSHRRQKREGSSPRRIRPADGSGRCRRAYLQRKSQRSGLHQIPRQDTELTCLRERMTRAGQSAYPSP